jgi:hypothetical protein
MKTQLLLIAALVAPLGVLTVRGQDYATPTSNLNREDVADRNAQELRQIRAQVDELARRASQPGEARFAPLYDALSDAEDALAAWKIAGSVDVSQRLADYEKARAKLLSLWRDFKTTAGQSAS